MKRKLLFANVALLALCAAGMAHLRREWMEAHSRERAFLQRLIQPVSPPPTPPLPSAESVKVKDYGDIVKKDLFSEDRNSVVVIESAPPKVVPMPPFPLFAGVADLGDGPMAIMSVETKGQRDYKPGDMVGAFKLVAVNNQDLVLEWEGQTITKKVDDIFDRTAGAARGGLVSAVRTPAAPPALSALAAPGADMGRGFKACKPGDTSPAGTVADGMRKVITSTSLGSRCYWDIDD